VTEEGPRIYGRCGEVEITVEGVEDESTEDLVPIFQDRLDELRQTWEDLSWNGEPR